MKNKFFFTFAFMVGLATYASSSWAVSSESLSRAGLSANADLFPFINLTFSIPSDGTFLTQGNFAVTEDGKPQTIRDFIPPESGGGDVRIVDIVFVHDDSDSLNDEAEKVKENIESFLAALARSNLDYRIGLVPYGGYFSFSPPEGKILNNGNLHSDSESLNKEIERMRFDGVTEMAYAAMQLAVRDINWRPSAQKLLILITDEDNDGSSVTENELINELRAANATVYALTDPELDDNDFDQIVAQTGGKRFNVTDDFSIILNEIGTTLSAQYLLQYQTDNLPLDGQPRTVKLTVKASDAQGTALQETFTAYYTPIPPIQTTLTPDTFAVTQTAQNEQSPIRIVAEIARQNVSASVTAYCFYKAQASVFYSVAMTHRGNNLYEAFIPAEGVLPPFVNFYIEAEDTQGKTTLPSVDPAIQPFTISVLPNELPLITHTPTTFLQQGQDIVISATVTDTTNQVSKVTLYYRKTGRVAYREVSQAFNQTDVQFTATIPGEDVTANGIQYYLSAEDNLGALNTFATADAPNEPTTNAPQTPITPVQEEEEDGGGCTLGNRKAPFDPLFPLLVMLSLLYLYRRRLISNSK
jgi:VWFA-related protein